MDMNVTNPDERNPLLMPELVSVCLSAVGASLLVVAVVAVFHWLA